MVRYLIAAELISGASVPFGTITKWISTNFKILKQRTAMQKRRDEVGQASVAPLFPSR
jgi:hypothetical protein